MQRDLAELLEEDRVGWPQVAEWLRGGRNHARVLETDRVRREQTLAALGLSDRCALGAVASRTAAILFDQGWVRLLGSGSDEVTGSLVTWNGLGSGTPPDPPLNGALLVAHDAVGGFFALNGGAFPGERGPVFYFAPDTLEWEDIALAYSQFVESLANGDLARFYERSRWPGWDRDVAGISPDQGFSIYPFLCANGPPVAERSRRPVPMRELWYAHQELARQLADTPPGGAFEGHFRDGDEDERQGNGRSS